MAGLPLRRSEPAGVSFLVMFGLSGYLLMRHSALSPGPIVLSALLLGVAWAALMTRAAIATARLTPAHDPEDPRYALQGCVAVVSAPIPASGEGTITFTEGTSARVVAARTIDNGAVGAGEEVCIERVEDGVAFVELWAAVESRL